MDKPRERVVDETGRRKAEPSREAFRVAVVAGADFIPSRYYHLTD
jgi:hypothetical protein